MTKSKMSIHPLGDNVIVRRNDAVGKTSGGIVIPDSAKEKPKRGTIKAVGPGKLLDDGERARMQVKEGDEVFFTSYSGTDVQIDDEKLVVMSENDILGVIV